MIHLRIFHPFICHQQQHTRVKMARGHLFQSSGDARNGQRGPTTDRSHLMTTLSKPATKELMSGRYNWDDKLTVWFHFNAARTRSSESLTLRLALIRLQSSVRQMSHKLVELLEVYGLQDNAIKCRLHLALTHLIYSHRLFEEEFPAQPLDGVRK